LRFLASPVELLAAGERVRALVYEENELVQSQGRSVARGTGRKHELLTGLVVRSIGYQGLPLPGAPFDAKRGIVPNLLGRVLAPDATPVPGLYVTGWIRRGPTGLIGTNKACARETVDQLLADLELLPAPTHDPAALDAVLAERGVNVVDYAGWHAIDSAETARGQAQGKVRDKFTRVEDMLAAAAKA